MARAYYNELDPCAAGWLRALIADGHIAQGDVDERSIADVSPADLVGYTQCHFFAGIGGWSYALRLAGWPDDRPCWTGSCPCQPYSAAGKGRGAADPRNLWPVWLPLIRECRPVRVFGEQVASAIGHGWLDAVSADLEAEGYTIGATVLGAHSVGAPHIRQRLYWVSHAERDRAQFPCGREAGGLGREQQPLPWDRTWEGALREFRVVDDGLSYGVEACNGPRNAIVPQVAAEVIRAYMDTRLTPCA